MSDPLQIFAGLRGFDTLTKDEHDRLTHASHVVSKAAGELLGRAGVEVTQYYAILSGSVSLYFLKPNGKRYIVRTYGSGTLLLLAQALGGTRFAGYLEVLDDAEILVIPAAETRQLIKSNPRFAQGLLSYLVNDNLSLTDAMSGFLVGGRARLCRILFQRALEAGVRCDGGIRFTLGEPKGRLASRLDMSPETLSRVFSQLKDEGVIEITDSVVIVHKIRDLVRISEGL